MPQLSQTNIRQSHLLILMGNECEGCQPRHAPGQLPGSQVSIKFIRQAWQQLKKQEDLPPTLHKKETIEKIQATINKKPSRATLELTPSNLHLKYQSGAYLYVGKMKQGVLNSQKAWVVLPRSKMYYSGSVKRNKIQGEGKVSWQVFNKNGVSRVQAKGKWEEEEIEVKLKFINSTLKSNMVHYLNADEIKKQNWVYLQFNNFDEYIGQVSEGKAHGMGTYIYRGKDKEACYPFYFGSFQAGERHGPGCLHYSPTMMLQIVWFHGKPEGPGKLLLKGEKYDVFYVKGKRQTKLVSVVE